MNLPGVTSPYPGLEPSQELWAVYREHAWVHATRYVFFPGVDDDDATRMMGLLAGRLTL